MRLTRPLMFVLVLFGLLAGSPTMAAGPDHSAQTSVPAAPAQARQFDFLIGQWDIELTPKVSSLAALIHGSPRLLGTWKAWRAFDGLGVEDQLRIVDGSGNPTNLGYAQRLYDGNSQRWLIGGLDVYRALFSRSEGQWREGEMHIDGTGTGRDGTPFKSRTRFFEISADSFRMQQDRSFDDGQSWEEASITISAKRVAATAPR